MITLYTKPGCQPCRLTKARLEDYGIAHQVVDVTQDADAFRHVTETLGYQGVPVVYVDDQNHWHGLRPDRLQALRG